MGGLFSKPKIPDPPEPLPPAAPSDADPAVEEEMRRQRKRRGRMDTILTSPTGVPSTTAGKKQLLGS